MRRTTLLVFTALTGTTGFTMSLYGQNDSGAATLHTVKLPADYRDWTLISVASVGPPVSDMRAKLGNDVAIKAYRAGTLPFPNGAIIARLAWKQAVSEENNRAIGPVAEKQLGPEGAKKLLSQSFVAGTPVNVQLMVKDSKKYAATGGWGFAQFDDGKAAGEAVVKTCFGCHGPAKDRDFVFTRYSP